MLVFCFKATMELRFTRCLSVLMDDLNNVLIKHCSLSSNSFLNLKIFQLKGQWKGGWMDQRPHRNPPSRL